MNTLSERLTPAEQRLLRKVAQGLIDIAAQAMPDTFFATDSRVKAARKLLALLEARGCSAAGRVP